MPLLYVLWTVAVLAIIASSMLGAGTQSYRLARNAADAARQDALADAAVNRAALALLDPRADHRWTARAEPWGFAFAGTEMSVTIQDELGRVDINQADTPLIAAALRAAGLSPQTASETADKILDWREPGPLKRLNGAKAADYASAEFPHRPRGGAFQSVEELRLVMGVTAQTYARLAPLVTVYSGRPMIDPATAPEALLKALSWQAPQRGSNTAGAYPSLDGRAFTIRAGPPDGAVRETVLRLTTSPSRAYWLLARRKMPHGE